MLKNVDKSFKCQCVKVLFPKKNGDKSVLYGSLVSKSGLYQIDKIYNQKKAHGHSSREDHGLSWGVPLC